jgi:hypothetical protein
VVYIPTDPNAPAAPAPQAQPGTPPNNASVIKQRFLLKNRMRPPVPAVPVPGQTMAAPAPAQTPVPPPVAPIKDPRSGDGSPYPKGVARDYSGFKFNDTPTQIERRRPDTMGRVGDKFYPGRVGHEGETSKKPVGSLLDAMRRRRDAINTSAKNDQNRHKSFEEHYEQAKREGTSAPGLVARMRYEGENIAHLDRTADRTPVKKSWNILDSIRNGAIGAGGKALGGVDKGIGTVGKTYGKLPKALQYAHAVINPITGIPMLAAANWDKIKGVGRKVVGGVQRFGRGIKNFAGRAINGIANVFRRKKK